MTLFGYIKTTPEDTVDPNNRMYRMLAATNMPQESCMLGYLHHSHVREEECRSLYDPQVEWIPAVCPTTHTILAQYTIPVSISPPADYAVKSVYPLQTERFVLGFTGKISDWNSHRMVTPRMLQNIETPGVILLGYLHYFLEKDRQLTVEEAIARVVHGLSGGYACWLLDRMYARLYLWRIRVPLHLFDIEEGTFFSCQQIAPYNLGIPIQRGCLMTWEFEKSHWIARPIFYMGEYA